MLFSPSGLWSLAREVLVSNIHIVDRDIPAGWGAWDRQPRKVVYEGKAIRSIRDEETVVAIFGCGRGSDGA